MNRNYFLIFLLVLTGAALGAKVVPLPDLVNPGGIQVDAKQIYIADGTTVKIYSRAEFRLIKKFGKRGEGPQEFMDYGSVMIDIYGDHIFINSIGKLSTFTKQGEFVKELKSTYGRHFRTLGKNFVGIGRDQDKGIVYQTVNIYNPNLEKVKEICRLEIDEQKTGIKFYSTPKVYRTYDDRLFLARKTDFEIEVFDQEGKFLYSYTKEYEKVKVTEADKNAVHNFFKTHPDLKDRYPSVKDRFIFPTHFTAIRDFQVVDKKIYVLTYNKKGKESEFYILDMQGKLLKKVFVPFIEADAMGFYAYAIANGKFYQLVDNEKTEVWELNIFDMK